MTNNTKKLKEIDDAIEGLGNQLNDLKLAFPNLDLDNNVICLTALKHLRESVAAMGEGEMPYKVYMQKSHDSKIFDTWCFDETFDDDVCYTRANGDTLKQFMEE